MFSLLLMMMELPLSDQASFEGPALIPIVVNNTKRGVNQYYQINNIISQIYLYMLLQLSELAYTRDCT